MKHFLLSIAVFLFAVSAGQAAEGVIQKPNVEMQLAGFPASGKKFPNNASGPPPTQEVWYLCSSTITKAPCTTSTTITQTARTLTNTFVFKLNPAAITQPIGASTITLALYTPTTTQQILNTVYAAVLPSVHGILLQRRHNYSSRFQGRIARLHKRTTRFLRLPPGQLFLRVRQHFLGLQPD